MLDRDKQVGTEEFWKDRIQNAPNIRYSIYEAPEPIWKAIEKDHIDILNKFINPDDYVLDAGCGYGRASEFIKCKKYLGIDLSPDFINAATMFYPHMDFCCSNLKSIPYDDNTFDISVCISLMIMIVQNMGWFEWEVIQNELLRVSKRGILCLEYGVTDTNTTSNTYFYINKE